MKRQELDRFHHASSTEIDLELLKLNQQLVEATMQLRMGELKNLHEPKNIRLSIAQLKSILRVKELAGEEIGKEKTTTLSSTLPKKKAEKKIAKESKDEVKTSKKPITKTSTKVVKAKKTSKAKSTKEEKS